MAPAFYDDHEDDQSHHHVKKSVLAMVKEKARRWRQRLAKKRRGHDEESDGGSSTTPAWGIQSGLGQSNERGGSDETTGSQLWDKGVSVKEYLMQKLEPGEEERALSQVISDTISPKKGGAWMERWG
ncbi:Low-temperature-induced 65 kDa protein [Acorus calamus]|uniref:Low-temperature-induced 65 kDa protein n=1 Tax=Acorus calamus TaxID=4465 RepID=A0AAV9F936_ACOCL|nr:Low-temperature-induced 65 kDa protein [Acorus calamus]